MAPCHMRQVARRRTRGGHAAYQIKFAGPARRAGRRRGAGRMPPAPAAVARARRRRSRLWGGVGFGGRWQPPRADVPWHQTSARIRYHRLRQRHIIGAGGRCRVAAVGAGSCCGRKFSSQGSTVPKIRFSVGEAGRYRCDAVPGQFTDVLLGARRRLQSAPATGSLRPDPVGERSRRSAIITAAPPRVLQAAPTIAALLGGGVAAGLGEAGRRRHAGYADVGRGAASVADRRPRHAVW